MLRTEEKPLESYDFPVYGTQGGGLVRQQGDGFIFVEVDKNLHHMGLNVGDKLPHEWDMIPANEAARQEMEREDPLNFEEDMWEGMRYY